MMNRSTSDLSYNLETKTVKQLIYEQQYEIPELLTNLKKQMIDYSSKNYNVFLQTETTFHKIREEAKLLQEETIKFATGRNKNLLHEYNKRANELGQKTIITELMTDDRDTILEKFKKTLENLQLTNQQAYKIERQKIQSSFDRYEKIMSILELPQLLRTCIQSQLYSEALDLYEAAVSLVNQYPHFVILENFTKECDQVMKLLLNQLLLRLKQDGCNIRNSIQIISLLRRMQIANDDELKMLFLQCRMHSLNNQQLEKNNVYEYLLKLTSNFRVGCFDTITQYKSVFSHHDSILSSCMLHLVQPYLNTLNHYLEESQLSGEEYRKLLEECMFCGSTLSKVGIDFRPLVSQWFSRKIHSNFKLYLTRSINHFVTCMESYKWNTNIKNNKLIEYVPLAELLNDVLMALNELKGCCPLDLVSQVTQNDMQTMLIEPLCKILIDIKRKKMPYFEQGEVRHFKGMCQCMIDEFASQLNALLGSFIKNNDVNIVVDCRYELFFDSLRREIQDI